MKRTALALTLAGWAFALSAQPAAEPSSEPASQTASRPATQEPASHLLPAEADAAWQAVELAARPPAVPADWSKRTPTAQERRDFQKSLSEKSASVAALAREFHSRFPQHAKAGEARAKEKKFSEQAAVYERRYAEPPAESSQPAPGLQQKLNDLHRRAALLKSQGMAAMVAEFEKGLRLLMQEHPQEPVLWQQLLTVVAKNSQPEQATPVLAEIVASKVAKAETITAARGMLKNLRALGQPFELKFTAADGREVDVAKLKGKVVLIDFWAAWCGPCMRTLPELSALYEKYHPQGLEIIGINLDKQRKAMDAVLERFHMSWPQYFDGKGWGNQLALDYNVTSIPALWLVDKNGLLRTLHAREDLEKQVENLLAEKL